MRLLTETSGSFCYSACSDRSVGVLAQPLCPDSLSAIIKYGVRFMPEKRGVFHNLG